MSDFDFNKSFLEALSLVAIQAGEAIMEVYHSSDMGVVRKADKTPVTQADFAANEIILRELKSKWSYPIHSEEAQVPWEERKCWTTYWLVDPLDGTKGFIKKNAEFTVNIALIHQNKSVAGVVHDPQLKKTWAAAQEMGSFCDKKKIFHDQNRDQLIGAASKDHGSKKTENFFNKNNISQIKRSGSSIKFCHLAQGLVDVYPRLSPTSEWDTAAGQIVCEESGCVVIDVETNESLKYHKENIRNNSFIAHKKGLSFKIT